MKNFKTVCVSELKSGDVLFYTGEVLQTDPHHLNVKYKMEFIVSGKNGAGSLYTKSLNRNKHVQIINN